MRFARILPFASIPIAGMAGWGTCYLYWRFMAYKAFGVWSSDTGIYWELMEAMFDSAAFCIFALGPLACFSSLRQFIYRKHLSIGYGILGGLFACFAGPVLFALAALDPIFFRLPYLPFIMPANLIIGLSSIAAYAALTDRKPATR